MMTNLVGQRIVITRATHQAESLVVLLREAGAIPIYYPCIDIAPVDPAQIQTHLRAIDTYDWLIFTSPNTVRMIAEQLQLTQIRPNWRQVKIAVVGTKTAHVLSDVLGREPDFIPDEFTGEHLGQTLPDVQNRQILLPQSALADDSLSAQLIDRGAHVVSFDAYRTVIGTGGDDVPAMLTRDEIDVITFTSGSTVDNFTRRIHPQPLPTTIPALCIGPSTAEVAHDAGFQQVIVPVHYNLRGMLQALEAYLQSR